MEINLDHRNLNLFNHFGDNADNENNTTRAFLIVLTRSPWSLILLRGFLDLLVERISSKKPGLARQFDTFFRPWPNTLQFSLERNISAENFPGEDVTAAILVALTPIEAAVPPETEILSVTATGRVDATIIARQPQSKEAIGIVIESKLYGPVGVDQMDRYRRRLEEKLIKT